MRILNWRAISAVLGKALFVVGSAGMIAFSAMYVFCLTAGDSYSDKKVIGMGISVFIVSLVCLYLYIYNQSNPYRRRAKRRRKFEKRRRLTIEEYDALNAEFRRNMRLVSQIPAARAGKYDISL